MRSLNRIIGICILLTLIIVRVSSYDFYQSTITVTLILTLILSIFLEFYFQLKTKKGLERWIIVLMTIMLVFFYGIVQLEPFFKHEAFILAKNKTFVNSEYKIIGSKPISLKHSDLRCFTIYEFKFGKLLIKELESVVGTWNDTLSTVVFPNTGLRYNYLTNEVYRFVPNSLSE